MKTKILSDKLSEYFPLNIPFYNKKKYKKLMQKLHLISKTTDFKKDKEFL